MGSFLTLRVPGRRDKPLPDGATRLVLGRKGFDAVLTGLRMLAKALDDGDVAPNDGDLGDILTCSGDHDGLTPDEVWMLGDLMMEVGADTSDHGLAAAVSEEAAHG